MKQQRAITELQASAPSVPFPKPTNIAFHNWRMKLRHVLAANNFYDASRTLEWSPDEECFSWQEHMSTVIGGEPCGVDFTFSIYPLLDIKTQLEALTEKRKKLSTACFKVAKEWRDANEE